jgi:lysozyme family protein
MSVIDLINGVIQREGGYVNKPSDPGGETNFGITKAVARAAGYLGEMKDLPKEKAFEIYNERFYCGPHFDDVYRASPLIACELVDIGVNQGVPQAASYLQKALNLFNLRGTTYADVVVDDNVGPGTMDSLKKYLSLRGIMGEKVLLKALTCMQGARYIDIGEKNPKLEDYEYGWFANRVTFPV